MCRQLAGVLACSTFAAVAAGGPIPPEPADAAFPGANGRIFFELDGNGGIWSVKPDGTDARRLTPVPASRTSGFFSDPQTSADGSLVTFSFGAPGAIGLMSPDGTNVRALPQRSPKGKPVEANDHAPSFSPSGKSIVFQRGLEGIYSMRLNGSDVTRLAPGGTDRSDPVYSPSGAHIAYVKSVRGDAEIFTMRSDGTRKRQLTHNEYPDGAPAYSPDGKTIAFHTEFPGGTVIYSMSSNGSPPRLLTNPQSPGERPEFSPDGRLIVFDVRRIAGPFDILTELPPLGLYYVSASGGPAFRLSNDRRIVNAQTANWQALPTREQLERAKRQRQKQRQKEQQEKKEKKEKKKRR